MNPNPLALSASEAWPDAWPAYWGHESTTLVVRPHAGAPVLYSTAVLGPLAAATDLVALPLRCGALRGGPHHVVVLVSPSLRRLQVHPLGSDARPQAVYTAPDGDDRWTTPVWVAATEHQVVLLGAGPPAASKDASSVDPAYWAAHPQRLWVWLRAGDGAPPTVVEVGDPGSAPDTHWTLSSSLAPFSRAQWGALELQPPPTDADVDDLVARRPPRPWSVHRLVAAVTSVSPTDLQVAVLTPGLLQDPSGPTSVDVLQLACYRARLVGATAPLQLTLTRLLPLDVVPDSRNWAAVTTLDQALHLYPYRVRFSAPGLWSPLYRESDRRAPNGPAAPVLLQARRRGRHPARVTLLGPQWTWPLAVPLEGPPVEGPANKNRRSDLRAAVGWVAALRRRGLSSPLVRYCAEAAGSHEPTDAAVLPYPQRLLPLRWVDPIDDVGHICRHLEAASGPMQRDPMSEALVRRHDPAGFLASDLRDRLWGGPDPVGVAAGARELLEHVGNSVLARGNPTWKQWLVAVWQPYQDPAGSRSAPRRLVLATRRVIRGWLTRQPEDIPAWVPRWSDLLPRGADLDPDLVSRVQALDTTTRPGGGPRPGCGPRLACGTLADWLADARATLGLGTGGPLGAGSTQAPAAADVHEALSFLTYLAFPLKASIRITPALKDVFSVLAELLGTDLLRLVARGSLSPVAAPGEPHPHPHPVQVLIDAGVVLTPDDALQVLMARGPPPPPEASPGARHRTPTVDAWWDTYRKSLWELGMRVAPERHPLAAGCLLQAPGVLDTVVHHLRDTHHQSSAPLSLLQSLVTLLDHAGPEVGAVVCTPDLGRAVEGMTRSALRTLQYTPSDAHARFILLTTERFGALWYRAAPAAWAATVQAWLQAEAEGGAAARPLATAVGVGAVLHTSPQFAEPALQQLWKAAVARLREVLPDLGSQVLAVGPLVRGSGGRDPVDRALDEVYLWVGRLAVLAQGGPRPAVVVVPGLHQALEPVAQVVRLTRDNRGWTGAPQLDLVNRLYMPLLRLVLQVLGQVEEEGPAPADAEAALGVLLRVVDLGQALEGPRGAGPLLDLGAAEACLGALVARVPHPASVLSEAARTYPALQGWLQRLEDTVVPGLM